MAGKLTAPGNATPERQGDIRVADRRYVKGERLVFVGAAPNVAFWEQRWEETKDDPTEFGAASNGKLGVIRRVYKRVLNKEDRILEAGCGNGNVVLALQMLGYICEGVDWAESTVKTSKKLFPWLPVRVGDVTHLDVPNGYYSAYISLGVMEHMPEGPDAFLKEAHRVLANEGVALIMVPYFHALRRLKARLRQYRPPSTADVFYQYAFTTEEFSAIVEKHGFAIERIVGYNAGLGLAKELPLVGRLLRIRIVGGAIWRACETFPFAARYFGHSFLVVARKNK